MESAAFNSDAYTAEYLSEARYSESPEMVEPLDIVETELGTTNQIDENGAENVSTEDEIVETRHLEHDHGNGQAANTESIPQRTSNTEGIPQRSDSIQEAEVRLGRLETAFTDLMQVLLDERQQMKKSENKGDPLGRTWGHSSLASTHGVHTGNTVFRWDQLKPIPRDLPTSRMWEAWRRFIETFEISTSLNSVTDAARKSQLLFLSLGEQMQGIVRAAQLRPRLDEPNCFDKFVENIDNYLKSMTDTAAEHDAFTRMRQEKGESAMAFHSRLTDKVRLCGYSDNDQLRFVRVQLLKGMANQELARTSRTFGYDANFIVQAATRCEDFEPETAAQSCSTENPVVLAINRNKRTFERIQHNNDRDRNRVAPEPQEKRFRGERAGERPHIGRRGRCSRCNYLAHHNVPCPALTRNCNTCGLRGHFSSTCRRRRVYNVQSGVRQVNHNKEDQTTDKV